MVTLVLVRHGQSQANVDNIFTGWTDALLTKKGRLQAQQVGVELLKRGIMFDQVHTSQLSRAIATANLILDESGQSYLPIYKNYRLNERHYGALRGLNKDEARRLFGVEQVALWRRSYTEVPPQIEIAEQEWIHGHLEPRSESLQMAYQRMLPYWIDEIAPQLLQHKNQLIVAHGSTIRTLVKLLENIDDAAIDQVEISNGQIIQYELDDQLVITSKLIIESE